MVYRVKVLFIFIFICISSFIYFYSAIKRNTVTFFSDEIYWAQTGRILPYILEGRFQDSYWEEHIGFTNFYGAKWVYALGLYLFGHTDYSAIEYPKNHADQFKYLDGSNVPVDDTFFPLIFHGRIISAVTVSLAIGLLFIFTLTIFPQQYFIGLFSAFIMVIHPTIYHVATHILADGMLLVAQLIALIFMTRIWRNRNNTYWYEYIALGASLGYAAAVKINGAMFYMLFLIVVTLLRSMRRISSWKMIIVLLTVTLVTVWTFFILHPHFYFYPSYSFLRMIQERVFITAHQMNYYSSIEPHRVLYTIPQRFFSLQKNIFTNINLPLFLLGALSTFIGLIQKTQFQYRIIVLQWINMLVITATLLSYVAFDDPRYFLPLLPFVCLISSAWIPNIQLTKDRKES